MLQPSHGAHSKLVSIFNPSSLDLATGDLSKLHLELAHFTRRSHLFSLLALQLFREGVALGTALLPNLTLVRGNNTFRATSIFEVRERTKDRICPSNELPSY